MELIEMGAKWYDPEIGRFISKGPLSGFVDKPQSLNRWAYVQNNPAVRTDPTGLLDQTCKKCGPKIDDWFL
jgi:RHS repeat-associated protein